MPRKPSEHVDNPAAVGRRLRKARRAAGLTQAQLSFPGCDPAYISRIEAGARTPSYQILREFGRRLGVSADFLATGAEATGHGGDPLFEADVAAGLGDLARAQEIYEQARLTEGPGVAARAAAGLGQLALRRGDLSEAVTLLEDALAGEQLPAADAALAANALGRCYVSQGRLDEAFAVFERFLSDARSRNDRFDVLRFSLLLANTYVDGGNYGRAQEVLADALGQVREVVDPMLRAGLYWSQSRLYSSEGQTDLAAQYAHMTVATLRTTEHTLEAARALLLLAHLENDRGNPAEALALVEEGEPAVLASGGSVDGGMFAIERARALDSLGESEEAVAILLGAVSKLNEASPRAAARAYASAASFFREKGDLARALELYELAEEGLQLPDRHRADVLTAMAEIHEERKDPERALQLLKEALHARTGTRTT